MHNAEASRYENLFIKALYHLCEVLEQSAGFMREDKLLRTQYNTDACAVDFLAKLGYVKITEGSWPENKHLTFEFTDKRKAELE